ncbi:DUF3159 domain-containing protein [Streptomonospora wellingtoniae]|uniref:DUF3159 domain-containing protein n=1 Tax=Streptomonospora wellingtoniae TaxID=3075544 RepID=A0ABU2KW14_9ACTN|nr:DUF3159 domain-containing protein [Streptomonospora sp. DSM 45055]MDT0303479.1 DUF3159 domain-containing protein [Streptomonospora sp. DSM 45055]
MALSGPTAAEDPFASPERTDAAPPAGPAAADRGGTRDRPGERAGTEEPADAKQAALDAMGGPWGIMASAVPTVVFATAVAVASLPVSIGIAVAVALGIAVVQLRRGATLGSASGGLIGVVTAGGVSALTGSANDFFLIGIWAALAIGAAALASLLLRRPLTGVIWNAVHGGTHAWRKDGPALLAHDTATLAVTLMCAARFGVQEWLYRADATSALALADTLMGFPLTGLVAVVVVWAFRHSTKRLLRPAAAAASRRS